MCEWQRWVFNVPKILLFLSLGFHPKDPAIFRVKSLLKAFCQFDPAGTRTGNRMIDSPSLFQLRHPDPLSITITSAIILVPASVLIDILWQLSFATWQPLLTILYSILKSTSKLYTLLPAFPVWKTQKNNSLSLWIASSVLNHPFALVKLRQPF